jgi:hypothetical protein
MITGNNERPIKEYWIIDHCSEGYYGITAGDGEKIVGIPYKWHSDNSIPFIEHRKNGTVIKTVNALDVSIITFDI